MSYIVYYHPILELEKRQVKKTCTPGQEVTHKSEK